MGSSFFLLLAPPPHLLISIPKQHPAAAAAGAQPNRRRSLTALENDGVSPAPVGELGGTLLTTTRESKPGRRRKEGERPEISGSDVLWAIQRASERKKKKKEEQRREEESSPGSGRREEDVDYANVRPLSVKSEWGDKLDELENRLRELSEII